MTSGLNFSIIIPVQDRVKDGKLRRCLNSVIHQTYPFFEAIIVDDGSKEDVEGLVNEFHSARFHYIRTDYSGRIVARNTGMEAARGDFLSWLDSDDALDAEYLNTFRYNIEGHPEAKLWVCSAIVHGMVQEAGKKHICPKWTLIREVWMPPIDPKGPGHIFFPSGKIGTGMFVFARECLKQTGLMPPWKTVYEVADGIHEWTGFLMDPPFYSAEKKWVGNPWGDDHAFFLKLCKFYRVHLINSALYVQYVR